MISQSRTLLDLHTNLLEMKQLLSHSSSGCSNRSEEGRGNQKMSPELLNKAFSEPEPAFLKSGTAIKNIHSIIV